MALGERLTELRNARNLTQIEVAEMLHMSRSTYAQYEVNRRIPEYNTLEKLADFYEVSLDYIVGRSDYRHIMKTGQSIFSNLDLSNTNSIAKIPMTYEGMSLTDDEKREFIAIVQGIFSVRRGSK